MYIYQIIKFLLTKIDSIYTDNIQSLCECWRKRKREKLNGNEKTKTAYGNLQISLRENLIRNKLFPLNLESSSHGDKKPEKIKKER
ncbi:hypothetical protein BH24ACI2_BH24ACI2_01170 [soil metagenome]